MVERGDEGEQHASDSARKNGGESAVASRVRELEELLKIEEEKNRFLMDELKSQTEIVLNSPEKENKILREKI